MRGTTGLALGALTALAGAALALPLLPLLLPALIRPAAAGRPRRVPGALAVRLTRAELRRLERWYGRRLPAPPEPDRAVRYLAARIPLGLLGGLVLALGAVGLSWTGFAALGWLFTSIEYPWAVLVTGLLGLFLVVLAAQGAHATVLLEWWLARRLLEPGRRDALERRIAQLATSRAEVMAAVDGERRRIERDLHDGVQQRLVALGMLIGRARRGGDPERVGRLLLQAHEESRRALTELREVAWRVYPTVLDEAGLRAALETVADRTPLPVRLACEVADPPERPVETVAYFVVSEAVTNVVKHAEATRVEVTVRRAGDTLRVRVEDDGSGGADLRGGGLTGLASRVAALDGRFGVHSPAGGPTVVTAELPCG
ncbi:sensor histidine kinase [Streptomyces yaizuensis]|uniref:histidine kinase n=1 Tax=Streptomyces yaizuensis TaxID=2989713 RepID=A0ABQ5NU60_9ACTN|nr:histidine kinase [Streptomyces sp. YSPA8]GLF93885.1 sensor histidine kinase [Streptomyces sp. YSPA8]